jgi:hypothetical protein
MGRPKPVVSREKNARPGRGEGNSMRELGVRRCARFRRPSWRGIETFNPFRWFQSTRPPTSLRSFGAGEPTTLARAEEVAIPVRSPDELNSADPARRSRERGFLGLIIAN